MNAVLSHFIATVNTFITFKQLKVPSEANLTIELPAKCDDRITLLFDLDETIVHCQSVAKTSNQEGQGERLMQNLLKEILSREFRETETISWSN